jgi:hypothetical protein
MSDHRMPPPDIQALIKRFREGSKSLSASELEAIVNWNVQAVETQTKRALETDAPETFGPFDIVAFTMPPTPQNRAYSINGVAYSGRCQAPYTTYLELVRKHQHAMMGAYELTQRRGSKTFGLSVYAQGFVPPKIPCTLVRRSNKRAA